MTTQLDLALGSADKADAGQGRPPRPGWIRLSTPGKKLDACYRHVASGWLVKHCGHPTANWPYYAVDPAHPHDITMTHNGLGWRRADLAFDAIERVLRGGLVATATRCANAVRRVTTPDDDVEARP